MCRDLRHRHDALVLVMTEGKEVKDEVRCLESGADDYLRKPFFPSQLLARIHALGRRGRSTLAQRPSSIISVGPLRVDSLHNEVSVYGKVSRLTPTESKLLHLLAVNANNVCTAGQIVSHIMQATQRGVPSSRFVNRCKLRTRGESGRFSSGYWYVTVCRSFGFIPINRFKL